MNLPLESIRTNGGTQPRAEINNITVFEYAEAMKTGAIFPPVVLFFDGTDHWLADGYHRYHATIEAGLATIVADIRQGTRRDAVLYSVGANATHGQRRTNDDKRRAVMVLLNDSEWVKWSDREIARKCGVSQPFVSSLRPPVSDNSYQIERRAIRNGTTYSVDTANIGRTPPPVIAPAVAPLLTHTLIADNPKEQIALARLPEPQQVEVAAKIVSGSAGVTEALRELKEERRENKREQNRQLIATTPAVTHQQNARYSTIVIDPPWDWGDEGDIDQFGRARPTYGTMSIEQITALPVGTLAQDNAHIYLWITNRSLPKGFALLEAWGFRYVTCLTWCKPSIGMGNYYRGSSEQVLFGVRGSLSLLQRNVGTWFEAPRPSLHSAKPDSFYTMIESCSPGPWLEMFARIPRQGWVSWGAEV